MNIISIFLFILIIIWLFIEIIYFTALKIKRYKNISFRLFEGNLFKLVNMILNNYVYMFKEKVVCNYDNEDEKEKLIEEYENDIRAINSAQIFINDKDNDEFRFIISLIINDSNIKGTINEFTIYVYNLDINDVILSSNINNSEKVIKFYSTKHLIRNSKYLEQLVSIIDAITTGKVENDYRLLSICGYYDKEYNDIPMNKEDKRNISNFELLMKFHKDGYQVATRKRNEYGE